MIMKCQHCSQPISETSKYCRYCGEKVARKNDNPDKEANWVGETKVVTPEKSNEDEPWFTPHPDKDKNATASEEPASKIKAVALRVLGVVGWGIGYLISKNFGIVFLIFIFAPLIAIGLTEKYLVNHKPSKGLVNGLAWCNLATWILPILGVTVGALSLHLSKYLLGSFQKKVRTLGWIGMILSIVNAIVGILMKLNTS
jgi:hypothetical protein